jgi:hypothetical protein
LVVIPLVLVMVIGSLLAGGIFTTLPIDRSTATDLRGGGDHQVSSPPTTPGQVTDARRQAK